MAENQTHSNFYGSPCYLQMRKIHSKMKVLEWSQQISQCKSMQIFYDAKGKLTPQSKVGSTLIFTKFKLIQALIVVLIVCKNEEDPFKIESTSAPSLKLVLL